MTLPTAPIGGVRLESATRACYFRSDGFISGSHLVPWGPGEFADTAVPLLREHRSLPRR